MHGALRGNAGYACTILCRSGRPGVIHFSAHRDKVGGARRKARIILLAHARAGTVRTVHRELPGAVHGRRVPALIDRREPRRGIGRIPRLHRPRPRLCGRRRSRIDNDVEGTGAIGDRDRISLFDIDLALGRAILRDDITIRRDLRGSQRIAPSAHIHLADRIRGGSRILSDFRSAAKRGDLIARRINNGRGNRVAIGQIEDGRLNRRIHAVQRGAIGPTDGNRPEVADDAEIAGGIQRAGIGRLIRQGRRGCQHVTIRLSRMGDSDRKQEQEGYE